MTEKEQISIVIDQCKAEKMISVEDAKLIMYSLLDKAEEREHELENEIANLNRVIVEQAEYFEVNSGYECGSKDEDEYKDDSSSISKSEKKLDEIFEKMITTLVEELEKID
jgi:hypothetical protein